MSKGVIAALANGLVFVTGKGGVGKSAVAAALSLALAEAGRRTLLLGIDPRENPHEWLGGAPRGGSPA